MTEERGDDTITARYAGNARLFGTSIVGALGEENMALKDAQAELTIAEKKIEAAACSLAGVYCPEIASGKAHRSQDEDDHTLLYSTRLPGFRASSEVQEKLVAVWREGLRNDRFQPVELLESVGRAVYEEVRPAVS